MKNLNRRQFIKSLALTGVFVFAKSASSYGREITKTFARTNSQLKDSTNKNNHSQTRSSTNKVLHDLKNDLAELCRKKEYKKAENGYLNLLEKYPEDISIYDSLSKLFRIGKRDLEAVNLFERGIEKNVDNVDYYDRLARNLNRISAGNEQQEKKYLDSHGQHPLLKSIELYMQAIEMAPNVSHLRYSLLDTVNILERKNSRLLKAKLNPIELNSEIRIKIKIITEAYISGWLQSKNHIHQQRYNEDSLRQEIEKLNTKKRRKLYFESQIQSRHLETQKRKNKYYSKLLDVVLKDGNSSKIIDVYKELFKLNDNNTNAKGLVISFLVKSKYYDELVDLYEWEISSGSALSIWTEVSYASALLKADVNNCSKSKKILENLLEKTKHIQSSKLQAAIAIALAECRFAEADYENGRRHLSNCMDTVVSGGIVNSLILKYADSYVKEEDYSTAISILEGTANGNMSTKDKTINRIIEQKNQKELIHQHSQIQNSSRNGSTSRMAVNSRLSNSSIDQNEELKLLYALVNVHIKANNKLEIENALAKINSIDPQDLFLMKYSNLQIK